jgi:hypothetical protein
MGDPMFTSDWKSHLVLACLTCEEVVLFIKTDEVLQAAREPLRKVFLYTQKANQGKLDRKRRERGIGED